jgi:hypothetical protein
MAQILNTPASSFAAANPRTLAVTVPSGTDKAVIGVLCNSSVALVSATLNSVSYARLRGETAGVLRLDVFEFDSPASGSVDFVIEWSGTPNSYIIPYCIGDVASGAPEDVDSAAVGSGALVLTLTTSVDALVLFFAKSQGSSAFTPAGGLTEDVDVDAGAIGTRYGSGHLIADATSESPEFTHDGSNAVCVGFSYANASPPPIPSRITLSFRPPA